MNAYEIGYYFGWLLLPGAGLALLLTGRKSKRQTEAVREYAIAQSAGWPEEGPASVPEVAGSVRVGFGIGILVLSVLGGVGQLARVVQERIEDSGVQVVMPLSLLGMERHDTYFPDQMSQTRARMPFALESSDVAWYGSPFGGVVVAAGRGQIGSPAREIDGVFRGIATDAAVLSREAVAPATPQGAAACARVQLPQKGSSERFFCVYVDRRSFVIVSDGEAMDIDAAAARGRSIQRAVMVKTSSAVARRHPSPVSTVKITLPPRLLGAKKDVKLIAKERADQLAQAAPFTRQVDLALYQSPSGDVFVVDALAADMTSRASFLRQYRAGIASESGKDPGAPILVSAAAGGGDGYCWKLVVEAAPTVVCALVDDEAYVVLHQLDTRDVAAVAAKTRQIRALVRKAS